MARTWNAHGMTGTPEYVAWACMKYRCLNPSDQSYRNYGGRGIRVCDEWMKFANFYRDMGPRPSPKHSIDRIDNDGDYTPENCRWATRREQTRNTRQVRYVTWKGERRRLIDLAEEHGMSYPALKGRLKRLGWTLEKALTTPVAPTRILSEKDVQEISSLYDGGVKKAEIARRFSISPSHAGAICNGVCW